jgi:preprotein translocase subunit YajC
MFISPAYAQAAGAAAPGGAGAIMQFAPLVLIFIVFYFLLIRPQQKKAKEHRALLSNLRRGDRVVTGGGIIGTVTRVVDKDDEISVEIADGVRVKVLRSTVTAVLSKPEPVAAKGSKAAKEKAEEETPAETSDDAETSSTEKS